MQIRVDEAESSAVRGGQKVIDGLEAKVTSLTADLDKETRCKNEYAKNWRSAERKLKELEFHREEDQKNLERMQVNYNSIQQYLA